jgi:beta-lactamase regulating signal transducer with metallopeptidase domain
MNSSLLLADMNGFTPLSPTIEALGWTLLHFAWQGTALALALACFLAMSRRTSPRMRYAAGCAALMAMCLGAVATFAWQMAAFNFRHIEQPAAESIVAVLPRVGSPLGKDAEPGETASIPVPSFPIERVSSERTRPAHNTSGEVEATAAPIARITPSRLPTERIWEPLRPWLSWIVGLWAVGVGFLALRLAAGWPVIRRLRAQAEKPKDPVWSARLDRLRVRLGVSSPVRLLSSASATVPMVIGWLRPVVLVPAGLLTGLSVAQLEAVFAHELAHIRRHDYLINLLQNVVETLFFYHPAVWWASQQVRSEREHCCDDLAAATCGGPLDYARALTALAELRHTSGALGLAATGGSLVGRMRRLAGFDVPGPRLGWPLPALVLAAGAVTALFIANSSSRSDEAHNAVASGQRPVTGSVRGRLLDPWGKPVANATVWLAAADMKKHFFRGLPVVAHSQSTADGRFELPTGPSTVQQLADGTPVRFEIWTRKPGLALTCQVERDGLPDNAIEIRMKAEEPVSVRLRNPNGSPCSNAVVAPMSVQYGDERFLTIPETVRNDLQVRSAADGRVAFVGLTAEEIAELRVETPDFAAQCCRFPSREWPDSGLPDITLRKTGKLEGRLIAPAGLEPDLSRVKLHIVTYFNNMKPATVAWNEQMTVQPDKKGRFTVPKIAEGSVWILADIPDDCDCRTDGFGYSAERATERLLITPDQTSKVEIAMWKGVRATRRVRDAETKKPLPGVAVILQHSNEWVRAKTDAQGVFAAWIRPDVAYQLSLELPIGYVRRNSASFDPVLVSSRAARREMYPIELFRGRSIEGIVIDPAGQPFGGVRVGADWRLPGEEPANKRTAGVQARKWTKADTQGHFRFDDLVSGVEITLTPVRAEMVLADPLRVEPANDKPVRLRTGRFDFSVISGCIIDRSGYPVAGAEVVVQVLRPNETVNALRLRTDPFGRFKTPAYFPKQFEYRVTVRSRCQDVASSAPRRLSELNGQFPDLVIDRPDAVDSAKLARSEVVAIVNGEPIFASDVLERASAAPLEPTGISLVVATKEMGATRLALQCE